MIADGFADVLPDASGLGIDLNKEAMKAMMPTRVKSTLNLHLSVTGQECPITNYGI
jgi:hypothetical protein